MKIVHISDLHFGRENRLVVASLLNEICSIQPNVVVVSGDLTQRARRHQFIKAAQFLKRIPFPKVVVPGNHDVPLYDIIRRFWSPLKRYSRYINNDFFPLYEDEQVVVIGINSAYSFTWKSGRITPSELDVLASKLEGTGVGTKILVVHHPFYEIFFNKAYRETLAALKLDMVLSGHLHQSSAEIVSDPITRLNEGVLIVQAGTAVSTRLRRENNSFNCIEIYPEKHASITIKEFDGEKFAEKKKKNFIKEEGKWSVS
jgi:predicted phosphodiesterase